MLFWNYAALKSCLAWAAHSPADQDAMALNDNLRLYPLKDNLYKVRVRFGDVFGGVIQPSDVRRQPLLRENRRRFVKTDNAAEAHGDRRAAMPLLSDP